MGESVSTHCTILCGKAKTFAWAIEFVHEGTHSPETEEFQEFRIDEQSPVP